MSRQHTIIALQRYSMAQSITHEEEDNGILIIKDTPDVYYHFMIHFISLDRNHICLNTLFEEKAGKTHPHLRT